MTSRELQLALDELKKNIQGSQLLIVGNKVDKKDINEIQQEFADFEVLFLSAKERLFIDDLKAKLVSLFDSRTVNVTETIVTNARHVEALRHTASAIQRTIDGLNNGVTGDFLAQDIRQALHYLGEITGEITTEDLLGNIFGKFCIGK